MFLKITSNLESIFEEKLNISPNLENTFKILKNNLYYFSKKH